MGHFQNPHISDAPTANITSGPYPSPEYYLRTLIKQLQDSASASPEREAIDARISKYEEKVESMAAFAALNSEPKAKVVVDPLPGALVRRSSREEMKDVERSLREQVDATLVQWAKHSPKPEPPAPQPTSNPPPAPSSSLSETPKPTLRQRFESFQQSRAGSTSNATEPAANVTHEQLTARLVALSALLKENHLKMSGQLQLDKEVVDAAAESLDGNVARLEKEGKKLKKLSARTWGTFWISMGIIAFVCVVWLFLFLFMRVFRPARGW
ncbi:hypothetical protein BJ742DRAFT_468412 [Cladochytrium replicatum]|nr:hypothetical protein BJ742DRAFT_468412 [Cladochytrium replicatum]